MTIQLIHGDCLKVLSRFSDHYFDAASFSPPYGLASEGFDIRCDFRSGGAFIPFMKEICRVSKVVAVNFTQRVVNGKLSPFTEELVIELQSHGIELFDRWVVVKPAAMPKRGERALTNYEFVLLFATDQKAIRKCVVEHENDFKTVIQVRGGHNASNVKVLGTTPYFPEIPRQVFELYGRSRGRVLDPFAGSGTSLQVAESLGIDSVGVEFNEAIFKQTSDNLGIQ